MGSYFQRARAVLRGLVRGVPTRRAGAPTPPDAAGGTRPRTREGLALIDLIDLIEGGADRTAPASWVNAFDAAVSRSLALSAESLAIIRQEVTRYGPEAFFPAERDGQRFLEFLRPRPGLSVALAQMHACGLLGAMFPESGTRSFVAIQQLERLLDLTTLSGQRFGSMLRELKAPQLLVLVLLLHDIGTSKDETHVEEGLQIAKAALDRLRVAGDARQTVEFLIRARFEMARVAFRRDAGDPEVIRDFAALFSSEEHLKMLCLMTLADLGATSPDTLTPWKEELLWRLFVDTYNQMTMGYGDEVIDENEAALASLQAGRPSDIQEGEMATFLEGLPRRYLTLFGADDVYRHVRLWRDIRPDDVHFFLNKKADVWELAVVTLDKPFLFSNVCGTLAYFGLDILRGHALTSRASLVLDVFDFVDSRGFFQADGAEAQFNRLLSDVVAGRADVTSLLREREPIAPRRDSVRTAPVIYFDNTYSPRYTVLELVSDDAPGLLHRISRVISRHGCDVDLVLISTEGQKAVDVFHVRRGAAKLTDADQLAVTEDLERLLREGREMGR